MYRLFVCTHVFVKWSILPVFGSIWIGLIFFARNYPVVEEVCTKAFIALFAVLLFYSGLRSRVQKRREESLHRDAFGVYIWIDLTGREQRSVEDPCLEDGAWDQEDGGFGDSGGGDGDGGGDGGGGD